MSIKADSPDIQLRSDGARKISIPGPDRAGQPVACGIRPFHSFSPVINRHDRQQRSERFTVHQAHIVSHAGDDGRGIEESFAIQPRAARQDPGAF